MKITLIDGNNWFRRRIEADLTGKPVSTCFYEVQQMINYPIIVWDGYKALSSRRKIYPDYKVSRKQAGESIYASQDTLKKVLKFGKGVSIEIEGTEADDIIAHLAHKYNKDHDLYIESNDADFAQLGLPMSRNQFHVDPEWVVLYKTLVGDPSDNIPGAKGLGKGIFAKLTSQDKLHLEAIVCSHINENEGTVRQRLEAIEALPAGVVKWMTSKENRENLLNMHRIIKFIPLSDEVVSKNTYTNLNKPELAQPIFEEFML